MAQSSRPAVYCHVGDSHMFKLEGEEMRKFLLTLAIVALLVLDAARFFTQPQVTFAQQGPSAQYAYISTATTTTVDAQSGYLLNVTINGGTAGVVTLFDISGTGCTGTPGSGKFATIETIGATNPVTLNYGLKTKNGLCVVTAAATDVTVTFN